MVADIASTRTQLEELHDLPTPVRSWLVEEGADATHDPPVWVWALVEQDDGNPERSTASRSSRARWSNTRARCGRSF